jgi:tetratricopeptide (TPR) repeat protein
MLAKATAVTIPVIVVLIDLWRARPATARGIAAEGLRLVRKHWDLVALAAATSVLAVFAQRAAEAMVGYEALSLPRRVVLTFFAAAFCVLKTLWPSGLAALHQGYIGSTWEFHPFVWWEAGVGFALVAAAFAFGWIRRRSGLGPLALAVACFFMILPAGGLGQSGPQTAAERYTYQPGWVVTFAIAWLAASLVDRLARRAPWLVAGLPAAALGVLACLAILQQRTWHDTGTLWERQVEVYPTSPTGNHHLGFWYLEHQPPDFERSERYLRKAVSVAPAYAEPRRTLAGLLYSTGRTAEAIDVLEPVLALKQDDPSTLFLMGKMLWEVGRRPEALASLERLVAVDDRSAESWRQLAKAQAAASRPSDAVATFEKGLAKTRDPALMGDFSWLLATHPDPAIRDGRRAVELSTGATSGPLADPRDVVRVAAAHAEAGDFERAIREVHEAMPRLPASSGPAMTHLLEDLERRAPIRVEPRYP